MKNLLLIAFACLAFGCSRKVTQLSTTKTDSTTTVIQTAQRDTVLTIGADSVNARLSLELPVHHHEAGSTPAPSLPVVKKGKRSQLTLQQVGKQVIATCLCVEAEVKAKLYDQLIKTRREVNEVIVKTVPERYIPKFTLYMSYVGIAAIILLIIFIVLKYIKPF